ncbi:hypothetical protein ACU8KH_01386 [Lachancea thermotolerans]
MPPGFARVPTKHERNPNEIADPDQFWPNARAAGPSKVRLAILPVCRRRAAWSELQRANFTEKPPRILIRGPFGDESQLVTDFSFVPLNNSNFPLQVEAQLNFPGGNEVVQSPASGQTDLRKARTSPLELPPARPLLCHKIGSSSSFAQYDPRPNGYAVFEPEDESVKNYLNYTYFLLQVYSSDDIACC